MRFYEIRLLDHFHSGGFANNLLSNFFFYTLHPTVSLCTKSSTMSTKIALLEGLAAHNHKALHQRKFDGEDTSLSNTQ